MAKMTFVQHEKPAKAEPETPRWVCPDEVYLNDDGNLVKIFLEDYPSSPRDMYDCLGTFYTWNRGIISPDEGPDFEQFLEQVGIDEAELGDNLETWLPKLSWLLEQKGYAAFPVSRYEHGEVIYRVGSPSQFPDARWDACYAGIIFASPEDIEKERFGEETLEDACARMKRILPGEVEVYSEWANGRVFGFITYDEHGDEVPDGSCWGFYGDDPEKSGLAEEAGGLYVCSYKSLDDYLDAKERERFVQHWKADITDVHETLTGAQEDSVRMAMAERALEIDGEG